MNSSRLNFLAVDLLSAITFMLLIYAAVKSAAATVNRNSPHSLSSKPGQDWIFDNRRICFHEERRCEAFWQKLFMPSLQHYALLNPTWANTSALITDRSSFILIALLFKKLETDEKYRESSSSFTKMNWSKDLIFHGFILFSSRYDAKSVRNSHKRTPSDHQSELCTSMNLASMYRIEL
ncbi:hypothetical protein M514_09357 [Trichuris suis]|nr:hypothetical protein M514_09357 [Trichuris suis]